eukprot:4161031-Amphidinium_carterae.1
MQLLGIRVSMKDSKRKPFAECFDMLGVSIRFGVIVQGFGLSIVVSNTDSRAKELRDELDKIEANGNGTLDCHEASRLRGRFGFFLTALWSRSGALFLWALELRLRASGPLHRTALTANEQFAIHAARR